MYRKSFVCEASNMSYDFDTRIGVVHLPKDNTPDFRGVMSIFQYIDPEVKEVLVFEDGNIQLRHRKSKDPRDFKGRIDPEKWHPKTEQWVTDFYR